MRNGRRGRNAAVARPAYRGEWPAGCTPILPAIARLSCAEKCGSKPLTLKRDIPSLQAARVDQVPGGDQRASLSTTLSLPSDCSDASLAATGAALLASERRFRCLVAAAEQQERARLPELEPAPQATPARPSHSDADAWAGHEGHTRRLVAAGDYVGAYLSLSAALPARSGDPTQLAVLRARRAQCSSALMNYRECIDDCHAALSALQGAGCSPAPPPLEDAEAVAVARLALRAHVMREEYAEARALCQALLSPEAGPYRPSAVQAAVLRREMESLSALEQFRDAAAAEDWPRALELLAAAEPFVRETPLCLLEAIARLETGDVDGAREVLLPHMLNISPPPAVAGTGAGPVGGSQERRLLRCNVDAHYLVATALLAKASAYSGRAYMNIAAVLLKRCLTVCPAYAPALSLGDSLVRLEDAFDLADRCERSRDWPLLVRTLTEAATIDPLNTRLVAVVYLRRAKAHMASGRPLLAIEDCTASCGLDPAGRSGRAFHLRAQAYRQVGRLSDAAADLAKDAALFPNAATALSDADWLPPGSSRPARTEAPPRRSPADANRRSTPPHQRQPYQRPPVRASTAAAAAPRAQTLYDILRVPPQASADQIHRGFKHLTLQCHPDRVVSEPIGVQLHAAEMYKQIRNARDILIDEACRRTYDETLVLHLPQ